MNYFTIITGIATLISFVISFKEILPEYSIYINNISYILLGLVIGNIISIFDKSKIKIYNFKSSHIFVYSFYFILSIVTFVLILTTNDLELKILGSIGTFIFVTFFFLIPLLKDQNITITERIILSDAHKENGNYSEAIYHLQNAKDILSDNDIRKDKIENRILALKNKQIENSEI
ncbi:hypothetical protein [Aliarcobacter cryaerophilus]|uniref:hypothetical protein n=1 Tax=Aliarcobacter cryaerophilus TaxID=28198 RepID=UPI0011DFF07D|nr:hypothetical protein [Aliarcobacter cryaerophilus]